MVEHFSFGRVTFFTTSSPASNGKLKRVFSQLNVIKTDKRTLLSNESLDDLLQIATSNISLQEFHPDSAIDIWWKEKVRRPNQRTRKKYKKHKYNYSLWHNYYIKVNPRLLIMIKLCKYAAIY